MERGNGHRPAPQIRAADPGRGNGKGGDVKMDDVALHLLHLRKKQILDRMNRINGILRKRTSSLPAVISGLIL
jgi:hypothetical protein